MTLIHPGKLYLMKHGQIQASEDIFGYGEFLRAEAGLDNILPVDLGEIFKHFGLPPPQSTPLGNLQALLINSEYGYILVNSEEPELRQSFSLAHELVEMLFSELSQGKDLVGGWFLKQPGGFRENTKERLCNQTAANLLMPVNYIHQQIYQTGVNFDCARLVSSECKVSLSAALVQLTRNSPGKHAVILWRLKNKPTEIMNGSGSEQLSLFQTAIDLPPKKLRVEWSIRSPIGPFIPKDKSSENVSLIYSSWEGNIFTSGKERMTFDNRNAAWFYSENMPFESSGERYVISLVERLAQ